MDGFGGPGPRPAPYGGYGGPGLDARMHADLAKRMIHAEAGEGPLYAELPPSA